MTHKQLFYLGISIIFLLILLLGLRLSYQTESPQSPPIIQGQSTTQPSPTPTEKLTFKVTRVIDGDTIEIETGQRVRYIGIDSPETADPRAKIECFGKEASAKNKELVEGKEVRLEKDVSEIDKYGRLLRYVYLDNTMVNEWLVREGYAYAASFPPDVKYQEKLHQAQNLARQEKKGLWGSCPLSSPGVKTSAANISASTTNISSSGCLIKGNISSNDEKIYHLPGQRYYNQTKIDESKGERWFCTEEEAQRAGWRRSKVYLLPKPSHLFKSWVKA